MPACSRMSFVNASAAAGSVKPTRNTNPCIAMSGEVADSTEASVGANAIRPSNQLATSSDQENGASLSASARSRSSVHWSVIGRSASKSGIGNWASSPRSAASCSADGMTRHSKYIGAPAGTYAAAGPAPIERAEVMNMAATAPIAMARTATMPMTTARHSVKPRVVEVDSIMEGHDPLFRQLGFGRVAASIRPAPRTSTVDDHRLRAHPLREVDGNHRDQHGDEGDDVHHCGTLRHALPGCQDDARFRGSSVLPRGNPCARQAGPAEIAPWRIEYSR